MFFGHVRDITGDRSGARAVTGAVPEWRQERGQLQDLRKGNSEYLEKERELAKELPRQKMHLDELYIFFLSDFF